MEIVLRDLGREVPYQAALRLQEHLHTRCVSGAGANTLLLLEHHAVFTLGKGANRAHVLLSAEQLQERGLECIMTSRGGDVTYHGPGQLVAYPILRLHDAGLRVLEYVTALEEVLLRTVASFGVQATRDVRNRGIWVGSNKLAALGIRVSRQVTMHGLALNVAPKMTDYEGIVACGLAGVGVTSLAQLLPAVPSMPVVKEAFLTAFSEVFQAHLLQETHGD